MIEVFYRFVKRISGNVFVVKKFSILMCIELYILELKKKDNCLNKEIVFKICGEKKSYFE